MPLIDTSGELIIKPHSNGVTLVRPANKESFPSNSVNEIFSSPLSFYLLDRESRILNMNESTINSCGYPTAPRKFIGKRRTLVASKTIVEQLEREDYQVIQHNHMRIFEEDFLRLDEVLLPAMAFKFPLYNQSNQIIGLLGCSIIFSHNKDLSLVDALKLMLKIGLFQSHENQMTSLLQLPRKKINGVHLTEREHQCLQLLLQGNTAKTTAKKLALSNRTVEYYLENIKLKFNVHSKAELIDKILQQCD